MPNDQKKKKQQADTSNQPGARPVGLSMDDWGKIASLYAQYAQDEATRFADEAKNLYQQAQGVYDKLYERVPVYGEALGRVAQKASEWYPSPTNPKFVKNVAFRAAKAAPRVMRDR